MSTFEWVAVAVIAVVSSSRLVRLWTFDAFPPVRWVREHFIEWADSHTLTRPWAMLGWCPWCASFWITGTVVGWGWLTDFDGTDGTVWWLVNGTLAASYLAAILMVHDGDDSREDDD